jgi:hydrogenase expression/formation protein HypE
VARDRTALPNVPGRRIRAVLRDELVTLAHGAGGKATRDLVEALFLAELGNDALAALGDAAVVPGAGRLALSTDSYVVHPLEFPGGDIGELAVNGTVNDLAMAGSRPCWLTAGFVIEEGFPVATLRRIVHSMAVAARAAGVAVVAGDTKVVERGNADGLYVTTAGVGTLADGVDLGPHRLVPGDRVLLSGTLADHGMAVLVARGDLQLEAAIESDTAPLHELAAGLLELGDALRFMRDPTRGGLATALNEVADAAGLAIVLDEGALPVRPAVTAACEILGIDPLYVANEGTLIAIVAPEAAGEALARLRAHPLGADATLLGEVRAEPEGLVLLDTALGGTRIVDMLVGDPLPRIC